MYQLSESKELIARLFFLYGAADAFGRTSDAEAKARASGNADESALREVLFKFIIHFAFPALSLPSSHIREKIYFEIYAASPSRSPPPVYSS